MPLHLKLFAEIVHERELQQVNFTTVNDLYGVFWEEKQRRIRRRLGHACRWTDVIDTLCDYMSQQQQQDLFVPVDILDKFQEDVDAMVTEHVLILIKDNKEYAFFHHSFFDYAFARRFFARGYRLINWLQEGEQHLFRRSQIRQILIYSRGRESQPSSQYINDLQNLLTNRNVRFHIKHVVFALLKEVSDPMEEEWEILFTLLKDESYGLSRWAWYTIANSAAWFQLLDAQLDLISTWLQGEDEEWVQRAFFLLARVQEHFPDRCAELVEPYVGRSERWNERFVQLVQVAYIEAEIGSGRKFFDLFLRLIDEGILDNVGKHSQISDRDVWQLLSSMYK
ncbi:hypothetical protein GF348_21670, partial [candidate division KSB3 bacterium]|nr:hypothetical protein [candidate division KSB3 bacterium]